MEKAKILTRVAAFFLPALIILAVFAELGVYPFGAKSLLVVDMDGEYIDYFMRLGRIAREGGSLLRSWSMGMGLNMLGLIAFYTASPVSALLLLFPAEHLTEGVLLVTVLKFGLCGLLFSFYASYTFDVRRLANVAFSVAWAMCGYNFAYSSNLMWLDGVAFLPLVLLGVEKLLRENRLRLLVLSLAYVFLSSYYIGYMVGLFSFLYLTCRYFSQHSQPREYLHKLMRLVGSAALAACFCAFLLLPAYLSLRSGQDGGLWQELTSPLMSTRHSPVKLLTKLIPGVYDTLTDSGLPNVYVTAAAVLLLTLYFLNRCVPLREKLIFGGLGAFLILSFIWRLPDLIWHAMEEPTWFPARYSFVFSFLILHLALRCFRTPQGLTPPRLAAGIAVPILISAEIALSRYRHVQLRNVLVFCLLCAVYGVLFLSLRRGTATPGRRVALSGVALALICAETLYAAGGVFHGIDAQFGYTSRDEYYGYRDSWLPAVELLKERYSGAHRIEIAEQRSSNGGMALGYPGISHYSSTTDQNVNRLLRGFGYDAGTANELRYTPGNPLTGGLLGIRYVLSAREMGIGYELIDRCGNAGVYENMLYYPLAWFADSRTLTVDAARVDPFLLQNEWISAMSGAKGVEAPFQPLQATPALLDNMIRDALPDGVVAYAKQSDGQPARVELTVDNPAQMEAYTFLPVSSRRFARAYLFADGTALGRDLSYRQNTVHPIGSSDEITLRMELDSPRAYISGELFYGLNFQAAEKAAELARQHQLEFDCFTDTRVSGRITAPRDGLLATTFPYDSGWTIRVDGEKVQPQKMLGALLAVELSRGEHEIVMTYAPPGFTLGLAISIISICASASVLFFPRLRVIKSSRSLIPKRKKTG